jgi:hypothetical protein
LTRDQPIAGSLAVASFAINRLDLGIQSLPGAQLTGTLVVRMWQGIDRTRLVLESQADLGHVTDRQALTFFFAPEADAPGHTYTWEVSTDTPHSGVSLCAKADGTPSATLYGTDWQTAYQGELNVSERLGRLPRAYVVYSVETIPDEKAVIHRVLASSFDLRNAAVVGQPLDLPTAPGMLATPADIVNYDDTQVVLHVTVTRSGLLVLGDQFYTGWRAWVDGRPTAVIAANGVWRGVPLQPGVHTIEFRFQPSSVRLGLVLTLCGLALAAGLWFMGRRRCKASLEPVQIAPN